MALTNLLIRAAVTAATALLEIRYFALHDQADGVLYVAL
jgi:hypothetical protein